MLLRAAVLLGVAVRLTVWVLARQGNWRHGAYSGPLNIRALLQGGPFGRLIWPTMHTLLLALPKGAVHQTQLVITGFFRFTGEIFSSPLWLALAAVVFTASIAILQSSATQVSPRRLQIRPWRSSGARWPHALGSSG